MAAFNLTLQLFLVIPANPACRHDLILAAVYLMAVPVVVFWHHRIWAVYLMASLAYIASALEAAALF